MQTELMAGLINRGLNSATTTDWLNATRDMKVTAYDPAIASCCLSLVHNGKQGELLPCPVEESSDSVSPSEE
jgi:hypothetical protein